MGQDQTARQDEPPAVDEAVYAALYAALASNARGRAFLDEVARRARNADTVAALAALARIETKLNDKLNAPEVAAAPPAEPAAISDAGEPFSEIPSDEAFVPFELDAPEGPDADSEPLPEVPPPASHRASSADLLAQVMAMSPEERIALFS